MSTIWKFPFTVEDRFTINLPVAARILHVELQNGTPCLWAHIQRTEVHQPTWFRIFGTGQTIPDDVPLYHVATFQQGAFVWHVFMEEPPPF